MKDTGVSSVFAIVLFAIALILIFGCVFGFFHLRGCKSESFHSGCINAPNFNDPNFKNERFFHYDNINNLVASDPVHVSKDVLENSLMTAEDSDNYFGVAKKKSL